MSYIVAKYDVGRLILWSTRSGNKSNSTAGAGQVEASLPEELSVHIHFRKLKYC